MKYFKLKELTSSATAIIKCIDNTPSKEIEQNLIALVDDVLDVIREKCGFPINVTSGYRCVELNSAVGGAKTSQHMKGEAADLQGKNKEQTRKIFEVAKELNLHDQLLFEKNKKGVQWVHISYKRPKDLNRHQTIDNYIA